MAILASLAPLLVFAAFVLLLLVTLSAPIIDPIYLFRLAADVGGSAARASAGINFGVFGYCVSGVRYSVLGASGTRDGSCSPVRLGYTFDSTVTRILGGDGIARAISRTTAAVFILNPIAAGFAFFALLTAVFMWCKGRNGTSRFPSLLTFGLAGVAAVVSTIAFLANIIIVSIVRSRVRDESGDAIDMTYGNGVWMTLGAAVALWLAVGGALCGICACGGGRRRDYKDRPATY